MSESELETPAKAVPPRRMRRSDRLDEDDRLKPEFVRSVMDAGRGGRLPTRARALVEPLHPADIADLFELVDSDDRRALAAALADMLDGDVLAEMNEHVREELIDALEPHQVAEIAGELETDDAVAIIEDMEEDDQRAVLRALDPDDRAAIEEALTYPEESAGRLMQRDLIAVPEHWTVGQVIDYLRAGEDLTTDFWEIYVVDPQHRPVGTCMLSWVLRTPRRIAVADVMQREQTLIPVDMDQEEVALRFQKYALISAAVVDQAGRLVGMITVDDIVHIIQEEAGEDVLLLSGAGEGDINEPLARQLQEPGPLADRQSVHRPRRLERDRLLRRGDRGDGRARRADADRRVDRRQCRHPDHGGRGARAGDEPAHPLQHLADDLARDPPRPAQRRDHRDPDRPRRRPGLRQCPARRSDRGGDADQHRHCRAGRRDGPGHARAARSGSGGGLVAFSSP